MTELQLLFQEDNFEDSAIKNGVNLWNEADLMKALGYLSADAFKRVIQKAQQACLSLGIAIEESFVRQPDTSYRLTRFACYLIAINGDSKKPEVAAAQVYFAALADTFRSAIDQARDVDRVLIRDEVSEGEKSLSSTANRHGVENFAFFHNAGYRGMYNMNLSALMTKKGIGKGERLIDRMGKDEIAAHLFRISMTDAKIKNEGLKGQQSLESAAEKVGKHVRQSMIELSGQKPENLPVADPIKEVKKRLKSTNKEFKNWIPRLPSRNAFQTQQSPKIRTRSDGMSRIGKKIITRLERFTNDLEQGVDIARKYTCRQIVLDLAPKPFDAKRVLKTRQTLGLSQGLFARFLGVSVKTVRAWEQGTNSPQEIACRLMEEIQHAPDYWRKRLSELARSKTPASE